MIRADVIYLIAQSPDTHGVFDNPTETERMVYCTVRSVGMSEFYRAREYGLEPSLVFRLSDWHDYDGEKVLKWDNRRYSVIRTYIDGNSIDITAEEEKANATATSSGV